jgi:hypothetical protein
LPCVRPTALRTNFKIYALTGCYFEPTAGLEPATYALQERCATDCAKSACERAPAPTILRCRLPGAGRIAHYFVLVGVGVLLEVAAGVDVPPAVAVAEGVGVAVE